MRRHGKAFVYNNDVRYVLNEQQQQQQQQHHIVGFVLSKSLQDFLSLNNNIGCVVSTKSIPDHYRRSESDSL